MALCYYIYIPYPVDKSRSASWRLILWSGMLASLSLPTCASGLLPVSQHVTIPRTKNASQGCGFLACSLKQSHSKVHFAAHRTPRENEAKMTDPAGKPKEKTHDLLQSSLQLLAALVTGAFNSLAFLLFLAPPITLCLVWKHPYIVLPPAVAYYFLRYACLV